MLKKYLIVQLILMLLLCNTSYAQQDGERKKDSILKLIQLPDFPKATYDIRDYGAKIDTLFNNRQAIMNAIQECHKSGGGTVIIPEGIHYSKGPISLLSHVNLYFEPGAVLVFSANPEDYLPVVFTRWEGTEMYNYSPLIYTVDQENIAITGYGKIIGNGQQKWASYRDKQHDSMDRIRRMGTI